MEPKIGHPSADSGTPQIRSSERRDRNSRRSLRRLKPYAPFFALIALSLLVGTLNPRFFEFNNLIRIANSAAIPLVLSLGMTFIIVLGSIDLSVEGVLAIGAVLISLLVRNNGNSADLGWFGVVLAITGLRRDRMFERDRSRRLANTLFHGHARNVVYRCRSRHAGSRRIDCARARQGNPQLALERFAQFPDRGLGSPWRARNHLGDRAADQDRAVHLCDRRRRGLGGPFRHTRLKGSRLSSS